MKTELNPSALYWTSFNRFELRLSGEAVNDIAQSGPADNAVLFHVARTDFAKIAPDAIRAELKEYGGWNAEELADDNANRGRILWIAACNIGEEDSPDCSEPVGESNASTESAPTVTPAKPFPWEADGATYFYDAQNVRVCNGSMMGRRNCIPDDAATVKTLQIARVPCSDAGGDYDTGGAYWGALGSNPLYCAWGESDTEQAEFYVRAESRAEAIAAARKVFANAKF